MRVVQPEGQRGSLRWIQRAVNERWPSLNEPIQPAVGGAPIEWLSPLAKDNFAEYRDSAFLERLSLGHLVAELGNFWPVRGPQWDALARTDQGDIILVEAKSHIGEMCSPASAASEVSLARINRALDATAGALRAREGHADWSKFFYQLANRITHLHWLRERGERAWLVLVNFINDHEMGGPTSPEAWQAAYEVAYHVLGLPKRHALAPFIIEVYPDVG